MGLDAPGTVATVSNFSNQKCATSMKLVNSSYVNLAHLFSGGEGLKYICFGGVNIYTVIF